MIPRPKCPGRVTACPRMPAGSAPARRRWQTPDLVLRCGAVVLDDVNIRELDDAVERHGNWLSAKSVKVPVPAAHLTALEVLLLLEEAKAAGVPLENEQVMAVTASLMRILRFRARAVGLERFVIENSKQRQGVIERRREAGAPKELIAKLKSDAKAVQAAHDDSAVQVLEARGQELKKRVRSFDAGLTGLVKSLAKRQARFNLAGYGSAKLLAPTRQNLLVAWMRSQLQHLSFEVDWFLADARGTAASGPLGHDGEADAKAWHRLRGECLLALQNARIPGRVRAALFPSEVDVFVREKDRNEKRVSRAKKRIKTAG
jgi:hypothetical protein